MRNFRSSRIPSSCACRRWRTQTQPPSAASRHQSPPPRSPVSWASDQEAPASRQRRRTVSSSLAIPSVATRSLRRARSVSRPSRISLHPSHQRASANPGKSQAALSPRRPRSASWCRRPPHSVAASHRSRDNDQRHQHQSFLDPRPVHDGHHGCVHCGDGDNHNLTSTTLVAMNATTSSLFAETSRPQQPASAAPRPPPSRAAVSSGSGLALRRIMSTSPASSTPTNTPATSRRGIRFCMLRVRILQR